MAAGLLAAGCSSSSSSSPKPPSKTLTNVQMCSDLSDLHNLFAQVGYDDSLTATRTDFAKLLSTATSDLNQGPPAALSRAVTAVVGDLKVVNQWVQTKATQSDLVDNTQPSSVKNHFNDVGTQYKTIDDWSSKFCK